MSAVPSRITLAPARLHPTLRRMRDVGIWMVVGSLVALFAAGTVAGIARGSEATATVLPGWTTEAVTPIISAWGVPAGTVVAYVLLLDVALFGLGIVAVWLLLQRPWSGFRLYVALVLLLHVTVGGSAPVLLATAVPALTWTMVLTGLGWFGLFSLLLVFPDGRFVPRWIRWTIPAWAAVFVAFLYVDMDDAPPVLLAVGLLVLLVVGTTAQVYRYRRVSDAGTRQQTRWVLAALVAKVGFVVVVGTVRLAVPATTPRAAALVLELTALGVGYLISALLVLAIALAVVRRRLFDADVVVRRAVLYGALTTFVLLVYGVVVGLVGLLWPSGGVALAVLATAAAAVSLVPLHTWLQQRVVRAVYGARAEPYRMVSQLGERLASTGRPEDMMQTAVATIGPALGLHRASIVLTGQPLPVATYVDTGAAPGDEPSESFAIKHRQRRVGVLEVVPRRTEPLTPQDRDLLRNLAGQAGVAVAAAQASAELRLAREQAVAARDEERRRLHRDLHDGLGPTLASIYQRIDLAGELVGSDPSTSSRLLADTGVQIRDTIGEVRRLVYGLRPPRLDDLGLVEAVRTACDELSDGVRPVIAVRATGSPTELPAVVEVTAYRITLEAVTNAVRHADATRCLVEIDVVPGPTLCVTVTDDGTGTAADAPPGAGTRSMRERAAEVGGLLEITPARPSGTRVRAELPLSDGQHQ